MAEAFAVAGFVASIIQFVEFGTKLISRLNEFQSNIEDVPKSFQDIQTILPLLLDTLKRTKAQADDGHVCKNTQTALIPVVNGCNTQVELLNDILSKILPQEGDSSWKRSIKAISSVGQEKKVQQILERLRNYVQTLTYHQTTGSLKFKPDPDENKAGSSRNNSEGLSKETTLFLVPFVQDSQFVGREDVINKINEKLETEQRLALTGVGGVGYRQKYPDRPILWVFANTAERFEQAYRDIARRLNLPRWDDPATDVLRIVSDWLTDGDHNGWLMILDNADDESVFFNPSCNVNLHRIPLFSYLMPTSKGSMIITSRNRMAAFRLTNTAETIIDISPMDKDNAALLLKKKLPNDQSSASDINDLLVTLEHLPLAITQAAAYIALRQTRFTISKYLAHLRHNETILLKDMGDLRRDLEVPNSILKTWQISFNQIKSSYPKAADLLSLMSVLSRQGIPQLLLSKDKEASEVEDALDTLHDFLLIAPERDGGMFGMHRLVQLATKTWLASHNEIGKWENEALRLLSPFLSWKAGYRDILPHVEVVSEYIYHTKAQLLQQATISHHIATYSELQGKYNAALTKIQQVIDIQQRFFKMKDTTLIESLLLKALVLRRLGRYDKAEAISQELLESLEAPENPLDSNQNIKLKVLNSLASALEEQGRYKEAEGHCQLVLELAKKNLGEENVWTLTYMNNLAIILQRQGKYKSAEDMHQQELNLSKRIYGEKDVATLKSMSSLAVAMKAQGKLDEAEEIQCTLLDLRRGVLEDDHPFTLNMQFNLAITLNAQGRYSDCMELHQQVLKSRKRVLGDQHPDTIHSRKGVAAALRDTGQHEAAEKMLRTVLQQEEEVLGEAHPSTLNTVYLLARLQALRKQYQDASILYQRAVGGRHKVLGPDHPHTKQCQESYEELLAEMKSLEQD